MNFDQFRELKKSTDFDAKADELIRDIRTSLLPAIRAFNLRWTDVYDDIVNNISDRKYAELRDWSKKYCEETFGR